MSNYYDEWLEIKDDCEALVKSYQMQAERGMRESIEAISKEIIKECRKPKPDKVWIEFQAKNILHLLED